MAERPPIVFLPGIMGSRLYFPSAGKFWDPDSTWRMLRWMPVWPVRSDDDNRRELHAAQAAYVVLDPLDPDSMSPEEVFLGWGGVVWSFYAEFLRDLRELAGSRRAFAVGYDWRQDIRWLGEYVAGKLNKVLQSTGAQQVSVVTHSMGGLVLRSALRHDPSLAPRVAKFLSICQPTVGAVLLYRRLFTGLVSGRDGGKGVGDRAFRLLLGNDRGSFVSNMSGLPGAMQLLPSRFFPTDASQRAWHAGISGTVTHDVLYGSVASPPGLLDSAMRLAPEVAADFRDRVGEVADFHAFLGAPSGAGSSGPETYAICGLGEKTEVRIGFKGTKAVPVVTADGDGTVPALSARAMQVAPARLFDVAGLEHGTACVQPRVREIAREVLG
jgi:pimeloyl-ACP methyl ester carboxylesterase